MDHTLNTSNTMQIDWTASGEKRITQNVLNLISTWRYEIGYNRTMGINTEILDKPADVAASLYAAEVYRIVEEYEPRARVKEVRFHGIVDGNINSEVVIEIV